MKKKVAILFGGCSEEHDVSIKSAREIWKYIDKEKYVQILKETLESYEAL